MQNFPFLVTQNTPARNKAMVTTEQKGVEPVTPFKQVLSQQVKQESAKNKVHGQDKTPHKPLSEESQVEPGQAQASEETAEKNTGNVVSADKKDILTKWQHKSAKSAKHQEDPSLAAAETAPASQVAGMIAVQAQQAGIAQTVGNTPLPDASSMEATLLTEKAPGAISDRHSPQAAVAEPDLRSHDKQMLENDPNVKSTDSHPSTNQPQSFSTRLTESKERLTGDLPGLLEQVAASKRMQESAPSAMVMAQVPQVAEANKLPGSSNLIEAYPGKPGWDMAISQKVVWMVGAAEQSATLTLNPPELGPLQVVISVNNEKADTTFISENPDVRKALEDGIPALRDLMSEAGVQLGQANVSTGRQQEAFHQAQKEHNIVHSPSGADSQDGGKRQAGRVITRVQNGLVDTFA